MDNVFRVTVRMFFIVETLSIHRQVVVSCVKNIMYPFVKIP